MPPDALRLSTPGRRVRAVVTVALLAGLGYGSIRGHDAMFPLGPMSQYARWVPPNGTVDSVTVWADTTAGTHIPVQLDAQGVGVKRADIEAQLPQILKDPALLQTLATAQRRLHPGQPQFVRLYIIDATTYLHDREPVRRAVRTLLTWDVPP